MSPITGYWESLQSHVELVGNQLVTGGGSICLQAIFRAIGSFLAFASYKAKNFYFLNERTFIWQSSGKSPGFEPLPTLVRGCFWTGIWTGNSNGSWTDKQSSHFSTAKEISVKATFFFM